MNIGYREYKKENLNRWMVEIEPVLCKWRKQLIHF
jgi:hypothetical protein